MNDNWFIKDEFIQKFRLEMFASNAGENVS